MEGLDVSKLPIDLLLNILNIILLFLITRFLVYKPVKKFMQERRDKLEKEKADAIEQKKEAENLKEEYALKLAQAESDAKKTLLDSESDARQKASQIISDAKQQAEQIKADAVSQAEKEKADALSSLKDEVASLAVDISEKILSREVSDKDNERIIENFFKDGNTE